MLKITSQKDANNKIHSTKTMNRNSKT